MSHISFGCHTLKVMLPFILQQNVQMFSDISYTVQYGVAILMTFIAGTKLISLITSIYIYMFFESLCKNNLY
jgi:hypothetical protein